MMRLMPGLRIEILDFVHAVLEGPGQTFFDLRQERDALRYIEGSRVCRKSIMEEACKVAAREEYIRLKVPKLCYIRSSHHISHYTT